MCCYMQLVTNLMQLELFVFVLYLFSSVQSFSCVHLLATPWPAASQAPYPSPNPGACSSSFPSSWRCQPKISSSVFPFSSCLQYFLTSGSFQMNQFFPTGGQIIGASTSTSVLPVNSLDWFPLGCTGLISLQSKGLSRVFSRGRG